MIGRRVLLAGLLAVIGVALLSGMPPSAHARAVPPGCTSAIQGAQRMHADTRELSDGVLVLDGRTVVLDGPAAWRQDVPDDGTWTMRFHGMEWLVPAVVRDPAFLQVFLDRATAMPDPGWVAGGSELRVTGWSESAIRLRQLVGNCLYEYTRDARLVPVLEALASANLDPHRYRGRPLYAVHNHGAASNLVLLQSARLLKRDDWSRAAYDRLSADAATVFTECGMTREQSSTYDLLNVRLWQRVLDRAERAGLSLNALGATEADDTAVPPGDDTVTSGLQLMAERIHLARLAVAQLARPDGVLEAIGDGNPTTVPDLGIDRTSDPTDLWCPQRGWAANRTAWDDDLVHYTLRFGPHRGMHGHFDHGSLTWFAHGVPVFSDRGLYDKARGTRYSLAQSPASHTSFVPLGVTMQEPMPARRFLAEDVDQYQLTWSQQGIHLQRDLDFSLQEPVLHVVDRAWSAQEYTWRQRWQLAEGWQVLDRPTGAEPAARHGDLYLYGTCYSGAFMRGAPVNVETFPQWRVARPAVSLECGGAGREVKIDTLWIVSTVRGSLHWDRAAGEWWLRPDRPVLLPSRQMVL